MYSIEAGRAEALGELRRQRIVYEEGHVPVSSLPSMARERLCWTPMDGAHERTTRQSCDELPVHSADSVCGA